MPDLDKASTAYELLGVHSSAPGELISACYWAIAGDLQKKRATAPEADAELHLLTRVYESISDSDRRAEYNLSINGAREPLTKRALPRRRFFLLRPFRRNRYSVNWYVDPHEVLGLHPSAPQSVVPTAHRLMREVYMRQPPGSRREPRSFRSPTVPPVTVLVSVSSIPTCSGRLSVRSGIRPTYPGT